MTKKKRNLAIPRNARRGVADDNQNSVLFIKIQREKGHSKNKINKYWKMTIATRTSRLLSIYRFAKKKLIYSLQFASDLASNFYRVMSKNIIIFLRRVQPSRRQ